jgi:uncharacterized protein (TIGR00369 family)
MRSNTPSAITLNDANSVLLNAPFGPWWGFSVREVAYGQATVALAARPEHFRPGGVLQGGCCMTLADVAFWLATMTITGTDTPAVTLEMKTNFLRSASSDLECSSKVILTGRRVLYGDAFTYAADGKIIAHHTLTYLR